MPREWLCGASLEVSEPWGLCPGGTGKEVSRVEVQGDVEKEY